ncbi:hypothetical protein VKT23_012955 [Stygiomarasmius scandens]|uniref:Uncharacterized protein n=1 Tax=Marasmiellus scandens TaxID=2682957 RepID=A0ABR1J7I1_9AGAR
MRAPGTNDYEYNVPVYVNEDLSPGFHDLKIQNGHVNGIKSLILLDYVIFTSDDGTFETPDTRGDSDSSSKSLGKIVGLVVAVSVLLLVGGAGFLTWHCRRFRSLPKEPDCDNWHNTVTPYILDRNDTPLAPASSHTYNSWDRLAVELPPPSYEEPISSVALNEPPTRSKCVYR